MKFTVATIFLLVNPSALAFAPSMASRRASSSTEIKVAILDDIVSFFKGLSPAQKKTATTEAIENAVAASAEHGPTSPEARLAWETVEEMAASDNSVATQGNISDECLTDEDITNNCIEYGEKLDELSELVTEYKPKFDDIMTIANEMKSIKMQVAEAKPGADSPQLREAMENAKKITAEKGVSSKEAAIAWEEVEEIAAAGLDNSMGARLDEECFVDAALDACAAIDELNRVVSLSKNTE